MSAETISDLLRRVLEDRSISERSLASELDVSPNALNSWVRGYRTPEPPYVWRIAEMANVPIEYAMRLAGHLPGDVGQDLLATRPREGTLASVAAELTDKELDLVLHIAKTLLTLRGSRKKT